MLWNTQSNLTIENNIFYNPQNYAITRCSTLNTCSIDHNLVYGASALMADTNGCAVGVTQTGGDPNFVNPTAAPFDFHLQANSPARGSGMTAADIGAYQFAAPASLQIVNTTRGGAIWAVGDGWTITITGAVPMAQVEVAVGNWSATVGHADGSGNFTLSGNAYPGNIGTAYEVWTAGGAMVNPNPLVVTVVP